jgi:hypothetical protein
VAEDRIRCPASTLLPLCTPSIATSNRSGAGAPCPNRIGQMEACTADEFQTRDGMQFDRISGIDAIMADGVKLKFLDAPLTQEQLSQLIQIPAAGR